MLNNCFLFYHSQTVAEFTHQNSIIARDMQTLGCLLVELYLSPHCRNLSKTASLQQRYQSAIAMCQMYLHEIPR